MNKGINEQLLEDIQEIVPYGEWKIFIEELPKEIVGSRIMIYHRYTCSILIYEYTGTRWKNGFESTIKTSNLIKEWDFWRPFNNLKLPNEGLIDKYKNLIKKQSK